MMQFFFTKTPLAFLVASFWRDEAFSYLMARLPLVSLLSTTAHDSNPPLYYLLLKIWMFFFGKSELALRSLSFIFYWGTVYFIYKILHEHFRFSSKKSLIYLLFVVINPLLHYYAFEARMYSMIAFFGAALFYYLVKKNYRTYALVAFLGLFTHYFLALILLFHVLYVFFITHHEFKLFIRPLLRLFVWYIPWVIIVLFSRPPVGNQFWIIPPTWNEILFIPAIILTGFEKNTWMDFPYLTHISLILWGLLLSSVYPAFYAKKNKIKEFILLGGWAVLIPLFVFLISFWKPIFLPRYLIFSSVGMTLFIIWSIEMIGNKYIRVGMLVLISAILVVYSNGQILTRKKAPLKKTFASIQSELLKNDVVYVTNEYDFHPAQYYLPNTKIYIYKKTYEELPWYVGKVLIPKESIQSSLPTYPSRAFILSDGTYTIQSLR